MSKFILQFKQAHFHYTNIGKYLLKKKKKKKHWEVNFALGQGRNAYDNLTRQLYI